MRVEQVLVSLALLSTHLLNSSLVSGVFLSSLCIPQRNGIDIEIDRIYMRRAIALAAQANGKTSPNPCVGCVIVLNGTVIGEGWHRKAGTAHAEVNALLMAGVSAAGATAYVSLEPCNHYGRTPPCTHALLRHGITRVVAGMVDPDPRVSGYGLQYLRENGVVVNVAEEEEAALCRQLNAPFVFRVLMERAYSVVLTSVNKGGSVCDPFFKDLSEAGASSKSPSADSSEDLAALLQQLAPEINAIVLTSSQFLSTHPSVLNALPSHIAVAVTVSSSDSQLSSDVLQVKSRIQHVSRTVRGDVRRSDGDSSGSGSVIDSSGIVSGSVGDSLGSVVEGSGGTRRWMILTPGVDVPVHASSSCCGSASSTAAASVVPAAAVIAAATAAVVASDIEKKIDKGGAAERVDRDITEDVEMHCYESCIVPEGGEGGEGEQSTNTHHTSSSAGRNGRERQLLLSVVKQMAILGCNAVLLVADTVQRFEDLQCSGACQKLLIETQSAESGGQSGGHGAISPSDMGEGGVGGDNVDTSHMSAVNTILSTITGDASQGVVNDSGSAPEGRGGGGAVKYEANGGAFHSVYRLEERGVEVEEGQRNSEEVGEEIGNNGLRNRKNPLRVFAIRFWS